jgi:hypothetical protein
MRRRPEPLADGLSAWMRGEESVEAEGASQVAAECLARALAYLVAQDEANRKDIKR